MVATIRASVKPERPEAKAAARATSDESGSKFLRAGLK
jgi:hypothetical protein